MKRMLALICVVSLLTFVMLGCEPEEEVEEPEEPEEEEVVETQSIAIAAAGSGSGAYTAGATIGNILNREQDLFELSTMVTAGFGENHIMVEDGSAEFGMMMEMDIHDAYFGEGEYDEEHPSLRRVTTFLMGVGHIIVREDSGIEELEDIHGKSINVGVPAQFSRTLVDILMEAIDVDYDQDIDKFELDTDSALDALRDGRIDGTFNQATVPQGNITELATTADVKFISIPEEDFDKFNELADGLLLRAGFPADTYPGQDEDVLTWAAGASIVAHEDVDEEVVYEFTKLFWENMDVLQEESGAFHGLSVEEHAFTESQVPMHPGAERYYQEIGLK